MKKLLFILATLLSTVTFAQNQIMLTLQSNGDTIYVNEATIQKAAPFKGGTALVYTGNSGQDNTVYVNQLVADTNFIASVAVLKFKNASGGSIDSLSVNGVRISNNVTYTTNITTTITKLKDSINAFTSNPNYFATSTDSTLTIKYAGALANGLKVTKVKTDSITLDTANSKLTFSGGSGLGTGATAGLVQTGISTQLFMVVENGVNIILSKSNVVAFVKSGTGSSIFYSSKRYGVIRVTATVAALKSALDSL